jgi:hypothetical protein
MHTFHRSEAAFSLQKEYIERPALRLKLPMVTIDELTEDCLRFKNDNLINSAMLVWFTAFHRSSLIPPKLVRSDSMHNAVLVVSGNGTSYVYVTCVRNFIGLRFGS